MCVFGSRWYAAATTTTKLQTSEGSRASQSSPLWAYFRGSKFWCITIFNHIATARHLRTKNCCRIAFSFRKSYSFGSSLWSQSLRAPPYSRSHIALSHHYRSSACDDRISQRQIRAWEQCHQYWVRNNRIGGSNRGKCAHSEWDAHCHEWPQAQEKRHQVD